MFVQGGGRTASPSIVACASSGLTVVAPPSSEDKTHHESDEELNDQEAVNLVVLDDVHTKTYGMSHLREREDEQE